MFHISDLKKYQNCPRSFFYSLSDEKSFQPFSRIDSDLDELLARYLGADTYFKGQRNDDPSLFLTALEQHEWFFAARVALGELRVRIPVLHKIEGHFDLYFFMYRTSFRNPDLFSYSIIYDVLRKNGIDIGKVYCICLNPKYIRKGPVEVDQLFLMTDEYKGKELANVLSSDTADYLSMIGKIAHECLDDHPPLKTKSCHSRDLCPHFYECFPELNVKGDSILHLVSCAKKEEMRQNGAVMLRDVESSLIEGNAIQYAQIMASRNGGRFIDCVALNNWFSTFDSSSLTFLDFEWETFLVPEFDGMSPMSPACFEFSLYVFEKGEEKLHYSYVGEGDCREEFLKELFDHLPSAGAVFAYNARGAETVRLRELAEIFPEYRERIDTLIERFADLADPFIEGMVYDVAMEDNFSVKGLLSMMSDLSYGDLNVHNGMEAVYAHRLMERSEDKEKIREDLKEYCSLDAYSLVVIYNWLRDLL